jgi:hypothetical protein
MTLVINQLLDQRATTNDQTQEIENEEASEEKDTTKESAMLLWDWCLESDDEKVEYISIGYSQTTKAANHEGCSKIL